LSEWRKYEKIWTCYKTEYCLAWSAASDGRGVLLLHVACGTRGICQNKGAGWHVHCDTVRGGVLGAVYKGQEED